MALGKLHAIAKFSLNPYSTGSWVAGIYVDRVECIHYIVLILILLEVGLLVGNGNEYGFGC